MSTIPLPPITLRYNGLFDFDGMYAAVVDWAKNYGYLWLEKTYKHKVPSPSGAELEFEWEMTKNVTEYINYKIKITVHTWDTTEVEVDTNGKKNKLTNSRLYMILEGELETDWQKRFENKGKFAKALRGWIGKIKTPEVEGVYADQLYYRIWNLHAMLKKFFDLQSKKHVYKGYLGEG
ncbi:hypothetical protein HY496_03635 [Candidatus Woesearchaeota archaeon]|nr:hypothetical protein [Candidatus Woesearchaeota archaeon]